MQGDKTSVQTLNQWHNSCCRNEQSKKMDHWKCILCIKSSIFLIDYKIVLRNYNLWPYLKSKIDGINRDDGFPGIVLQSSSQESLWEEESWDPEDTRDTIINPILDKICPQDEVWNPGWEGFQGGVSLSSKEWNIIWISTLNVFIIKEIESPWAKISYIKMSFSTMTI